jgi:alkanesulfonate monooxygenase SsuD/methylene tetrahydromethanopterin reductase-like flavin-dependent oxidoreductase (luciferase family)
MSALIDDDMVHAFAIVGTPEEAFAEVRRRYGDLVTRITIAMPEDRDPKRWRALFESLQVPGMG